MKQLAVKIKDAFKNSFISVFKRCKGFTLIELLVCIMIIAVLTSISLPIYIKAHEKAKASEALTVLGAVASAEQRYALSNNGFSSNFNDLDVSLINKLGQVVDNDTLVLKDFNVTVSEGTNNVVNTAYVKADRVKEGSETVLYTLYRCIDDSKALCLDVDTTDRITCETLGFGGEANAMDPCGGAPVNDAASCGASGGYWLTASGTCYTSAQERCEVANGTLDTNTNVCNFMDTSSTFRDSILDEGMACYTGQHGTPETRACWHPIINGGTCYGNHDGGCYGATINDGGQCLGLSARYNCNNSTINEGGKCISSAFTNGSANCRGVTVNKGGVCIATEYGESGCTASTINDGGVCVGGAQNHVHYGYSCKENIVNSGGICIGTGYHSCRGNTVEDGGIVIANNSTAGYGNTYKGSGCCVDCTGSGYCHNSGHVCQLSASEKDRYCNMYKNYQ